MKEKVYNLSLALNWKLIGIISQIDRFDASWSSIERIEGKSLSQLKSIATIQSVGASTRIEGAKLSDAEVATLLSHIDVQNLEDRDSQEIVGYFDVLDLISDVYPTMQISESTIKNLHNQLLKYSRKDDWHRGNYKQTNNAVQATFPDGSTQIIFKTTDPGFATEQAMKELIDWFNQEKEVHPLIVCAAFVYEFLSIHPFQDGNGRLSRLLTTLILLRSGYQWIQYISFEHEIERNKKLYYQNLRNCQAQRPNEDITNWVDFFLDSLINVQYKLEKKLELNDVGNELSPKEKLVYTYILNHSGCKSGEIVEELSISKPTVKRIISDLLSKNLISKHGQGAGTNYSGK